MEFDILGQCLGIQGLNFDFIEELLPDPDAPRYLRNGEGILVKNGKVEKLRGVDYLNSVTTQLGAAGYRRVLGLPIFRKYAGTKSLLAVTPRNSYALTNNTTWSLIGQHAAGENTSIFTHATLNDQFIFTLSDHKTILSWDGATFGNLFAGATATDRQARFVLGLKTHLFLIRTIETNTEHYQRIWPSDVGSVTAFTDDNKLDLDSEGVIEGAKVLEGDIYVYLNNSVFRVYWGGADMGWLSDLITDSTGIIAPKTLCGSNDRHFFLAQEGLMQLVKGDVPRSISDGKFNRLILDEIDPVYFTKATAFFYPHLNLLCVSYPKSGATENDTQIIYDTTAKELVSKKTLGDHAYSTYGVFEKDLSSLSADARKQYGLSAVPIIGTSNGYVLEQCVAAYQDGVTPFESNLVLPPAFYGDPQRNKRVLQIDLLFEKLTDEDITFVVDVSTEANENVAFTYTITGDGDTGIRRYELRSDDNGVGVDFLGKVFTVKIRDSNNPYGWKFHGALFMGNVVGQK